MNRASDLASHQVFLDDRSVLVLRPCCPWILSQNITKYGRLKDVEEDYTSRACFRP